MSQILTLELNDRVFSAIRKQAEQIGITPEHLAATLLEQNLIRTIPEALSSAEDQQAKLRFEQQFGTLNLPTVPSLDNESIDADLAESYANSHGDE